MSTVTASFNTTVRQMTKMLQWPICHSKKWPKCLSEKKKPRSARSCPWSATAIH